MPAQKSAKPEKTVTKKPIKKSTVAAIDTSHRSNPKRARAITKPFRALGGYFKGAWSELRQVRWPDRAATWSLTLAVILFAVFFAGLILGLDSAFSYLIKKLF